MKNLQSLILDKTMPRGSTGPKTQCTCDYSEEKRSRANTGNKSFSAYTGKYEIMVNSPNRPRLSVLQSTNMHTVWTVGLFLCIIWCFHTVAAQDTMLIQHTGYAKKGHYHCSKHCSSMITHLEQRLHHRIRDTEQRCNQRIQTAIDANNKTAAIQHTEKLLHHVIEELQISGEQEDTREANFQKLRQTVSNQHHQIQRSKNTVNRLQKQVEDLSQIIEGLVSDQQQLNERLDSALARIEKLPANDDIGNDASNPPTPPPNVNTETDNLPFEPLFPADCQDAYDNHGGANYPGFSYIMIKPYTTRDAFEVCCKMSNNSGWTLIQRRFDGSVDFYRTWDEYKTGFGNLQGEFWLGNEHIYQLTNQGDYLIRIEMVDWEGKSYWAQYDHFKIGPEKDNYKLHVHGYHGTAGDSMTLGENHDNQSFSTHDRDNDLRFYDNCAQHYHGAWWFKSCYQSHLNGRYYKKGLHNNYFVRDGIQWNSIHIHSSLKQVMMMIKPNDAVKHDDIEPINNLIDV